MMQDLDIVTPTASMSASMQSYFSTDGSESSKGSGVSTGVVLLHAMHSESLSTPLLLLRPTVVEI